MTLNAKIKVFVDFLAISGCETYSKSELRRNQLRWTETIKLHRKLSALNVDFAVQVSIFWVQENLRTRASNSGTPGKVVIFTVVGQLISMGMLPITTSTSDELFSGINIDDFGRSWTSKIRVFIDCCDLRLQRTQARREPQRARGNILARPPNIFTGPLCWENFDFFFKTVYSGILYISQTSRGPGRPWLLARVESCIPESTCRAGDTSWSHAFEFRAYHHPTTWKYSP